MGIAIAIEYMIIDALLSADPHLDIAKRIFEPEKYLHLTDSIMPFIEATTDPASNPSLPSSYMFDCFFFYQELAPARAIFDRIHTRDIYKCVDFKVIDWPMRSLFQKHITAARIVEACRELTLVSASTEDADASSLQESDVVINFALMHYGMKEKNPLDFVRFYSKHHPTRGLFFLFLYLPINCNHREPQCSTRRLFGDDSTVVCGRPPSRLYQKA